MSIATLDPLQPLVLRLLRARPSTTEELRKRINEEGEMITSSRLSAILHDLRASGRINIRRHCQIVPSHQPRRQVWHLPGQEA